MWQPITIYPSHIEVGKHSPGVWEYHCMRQDKRKLVESLSLQLESTPIQECLNEELPYYQGVETTRATRQRLHRVRKAQLAVLFEQERQWECLDEQDRELLALCYTQRTEKSKELARLRAQWSLGTLTSMCHLQDERLTISKMHAAAAVQRTNTVLLRS